jgi:hypothetical protein
LCVFNLAAIDSCTGGLYFNVHTSAHPSGELRGRIIFSNTLNVNALLTAGVNTTEAVVQMQIIPSFDNSYAVVYAGASTLLCLLRLVACW